MIWRIKCKPKPVYKEWDTRIETRFALFPVEISESRKVWLQQYYVKRILLYSSSMGNWWTEATKHKYATIDEVVFEEYENPVNA